MAAFSEEFGIKGCSFKQLYASMMQIIPDDWLDWIASTLEEGANPDVIIGELINQGLESETAEKMVSLTLKRGRLVQKTNLASEKWVFRLAR